MRFTGLGYVILKMRVSAWDAKSCLASISRVVFWRGGGRSSNKCTKYMQIRYHSNHHMFGQQAAGSNGL